MLGFRFLKATPTTHVLHYRGGALVHDGVGLSFWYFAPAAVIAPVPVSSRDVPSGGVIFSDGVESDFLEFNGGTIARISVSKQRARLVVPDRRE